MGSRAQSRTSSSPSPSPPDRSGASHHQENFRSLAAVFLIIGLLALFTVELFYGTPVTTTMLSVIIGLILVLFGIDDAHWILARNGPDEPRNTPLVPEYWDKSVLRKYDEYQTEYSDDHLDAGDDTEDEYSDDRLGSEIEPDPDPDSDIESGSGSGSERNSTQTQQSESGDRDSTEYDVEADGGDNW